MSARPDDLRLHIRPCVSRTLLDTTKVALTVLFLRNMIALFTPIAAISALPRTKGNPRELPVGTVLEVFHTAAKAGAIIIVWSAI
jgi:hypothetical protein